MWKARLINKTLDQGRLVLTIEYSKDDNPETATNEVYTLADAPADINEWFDTTVTEKINKLKSLDDIQLTIPVEASIVPAPEPEVTENNPIDNEEAKAV